MPSRIVVVNVIVSENFRFMDSSDNLLKGDGGVRGILSKDNVQHRYSPSPGHSPGRLTDLPPVPNGE
jgi:hypothetical protein